MVSIIQTQSVFSKQQCSVLDSSWFQQIAMVTLRQSRINSTFHIRLELFSVKSNGLYLRSICLLQIAVVSIKFELPSDSICLQQMALVSIKLNLVIVRIRVNLSSVDSNGQPKIQSVFSILMVSIRLNLYSNGEYNIQSIFSRQQWSVFDLSRLQKLAKWTALYSNYLQ